MILRKIFIKNSTLTKKDEEKLDIIKHEWLIPPIFILWIITRLISALVSSNVGNSKPMALTHLFLATLANFFLIYGLLGVVAFVMRRIVRLIKSLHHH